MKNLKHLILSVGLLSLLAVAAAGCGSDQAAAPKEGTATTTPTVEAKATYVGDDACKACHSDVSTAFQATEHSAEALKPITEYQLTGGLPKVKLFDGVDKENTKPTEIDLSTAKLYGVMVNEYLLAEVPGFKNKIYRVAKLVKSGDKFDVKAAKSVDVDKDGKEDWQAADGEACAECHAPGLLVASPTLGISCESCHGPGSLHAAAAPDKKKGSYGAKPSTETCMGCHKSDPEKDDKGTLLANNHYGVRNYFASKHGQSKQLTGCLACHTPHKANAKGKLFAKDNAAEVCTTCHAGVKVDLEKLMWKNPTDERNHITADHSFGAMKYADLGDDAATKATEIKNPAFVDLVNKTFPDLGK
ncbi:MAG TPA: cytochrome c3 family protein [Bacillota bacterium]|nr:cytochrome c3 family protein [Bacillota bacterium]